MHRLCVIVKADRSCVRSDVDPLHHDLELAEVDAAVAVAVDVAAHLPDVGQAAGLGHAQLLEHLLQLRRRDEAVAVDVDGGDHLLAVLGAASLADAAEDLAELGDGDAAVAVDVVDVEGVAQLGVQLALPAAAAVEGGRLPGEIVRRFADLEKSPMFRWLLQFGGFRERLLADDLFLAKLAMEMGVGMIAKVRGIDMVES